MTGANMLNKALAIQTLVAIHLAAAPASADPPHARVPIRGFADWRLDCTVRPCRTHTAVTGTDGSEVLRLTRLPGDPAILEVSTRLAVYVPDGLVLTVGEEPPLPLVWRICGPDGCASRATVTPDLAAALRRERAGTLILTLADGVPVRVGVSLVGYVAALRALNAGS